MARLGERGDHRCGGVRRGEERHRGTATRQPTAPGASGDAGVECLGGVGHERQANASGGGGRRSLRSAASGRRVRRPARTARPGRGCGPHPAQHLGRARRRAIGRSTWWRRESTTTTDAARQQRPDPQRERPTVDPGDDAAEHRGRSIVAVALQSGRDLDDPVEPHRQRRSADHRAPTATPSAAPADAGRAAEAQTARPSGSTSGSRSARPSAPSGRHERLRSGMVAVDRSAHRREGHRARRRGTGRAPCPARRIRHRGSPTMPAPERRATQPPAWACDTLISPSRCAWARPSSIAAARQDEPVAEVVGQAGDDQTAGSIEDDDVAMGTGFAGKHTANGERRSPRASPPRRSSAVAGAKPYSLGIDGELGDDAVVQREHLRRPERGEFVHPRPVDDPCVGQALTLERLDHRAGEGGVGNADELALDPTGVGHRAEQVERGRNTQLAPRRAREPERRVEDRSEAEADPGLAHARSDAVGVQLDRDAEQLQHVGSTALRRRRPIAVFADRSSRSGHHQRCHGRHVDRVRAVATGSDDVDTTIAFVVGQRDVGRLVQRRCKQPARVLRRSPPWLAGRSGTHRSARRLRRREGSSSSPNPRLLRRDRHRRPAPTSRWASRGRGHGSTWAAA